MTRREIVFGLGSIGATGTLIALSVLTNGFAFVAFCVTAFIVLIFLAGVQLSHLRDHW